MPGILPELFARWFAARGWSPWPYQRAVLAAAQGGESDLLIAPASGGKTLAGFLPTLVDLAAEAHPDLHTLYVSPLKELAADIACNFECTFADIGMPITIAELSAIAIPPGNTSNGVCISGLTFAIRSRAPADLNRSPTSSTT